MKNFLTAAALALVLAPVLANLANAASTFDPGANSASPVFVAAQTSVNPANAVAAAADAQRYATVGDAVVGTHGAAARSVVEYDPGAADGQSAFVNKTILPGAAVVQTTRQSSVAYADNSELIGN